MPQRPIKFFHAHIVSSTKKLRIILILILKYTILFINYQIEEDINIIKLLVYIKYKNYNKFSNHTNINNNNIIRRLLWSMIEIGLL